MAILRDLRLGEFDVLIGINLLREGLDLPEVSLVAILDADKEGFLRSAGSLIQTIGRAARHINGKALLYADKRTDSMARALDETERRRQLQQAYNEEHGITPESIVKSIRSALHGRTESDEEGGEISLDGLSKESLLFGSPEEIHRELQKSRKAMKQAAKELDFEKAAEHRDRIRELEQMELFDS
jgi:excinuclease ABC subunit B